MRATPSSSSSWARTRARASRTTSCAPRCSCRWRRRRQTGGAWDRGGQAMVSGACDVLLRWPALWSQRGVAFWVHGAGVAWDGSVQSVSPSPAAVHPLHLILASAALQPASELHCCPPHRHLQGVRRGAGRGGRLWQLYRPHQHCAAGAVQQGLPGWGNVGWLQRSPVLLWTLHAV